MSNYYIDYQIMPRAGNSQGLATVVLIFLFLGTRIPDRYRNRVPGSKNIRKRTGLVLTAARQQWTLDSDSELDFDGFVTVEFGENGHFAANLAPKTMWINFLDWDVRCQQ